jgi:antitoxin (DNA-binding transcriptional repressor) of toxin-antitoxin stability system
MKEVSIEGLKRNVGQWVRLAAGREPIIITDGGKPVATLAGLEPPHHSRRLPDREAKIRQRSQITVDSVDDLSELRD